MQDLLCSGSPASGIWKMLRKQRLDTTESSISLLCLTSASGLALLLPGLRNPGQKAISPPPVPLLPDGLILNLDLLDMSLTGPSKSLNTKNVTLLTNSFVL